MATFRLATFNVENLYSRPDFWDPRKPDDQRVGTVRFEDRDEAVTALRIANAALSDDKCQLTARALLATDADIVCLQEVDNEAALTLFRDEYLKKLEGPLVAQTMKAVIFADPPPDKTTIEKAREAAISRVNYRHLAVVEGNDGRGIDVGILARRGWQNIVTHRYVTFAELDVWPKGIENYEDHKGAPKPKRSDRIFRRDCLEVVYEIDGKPLTLFICHFKSMSGGRDATRVMREAEAEAVRKIIERRFRDHPGGVAAANWAICGDLNDYYEIDGSRDLRDLRTGEKSPSALDVLLRDGFAVNIMERRDARDRWTTYHAPDDSYTQLDYVLLSPALARANPDAVPEIVRIGQPWRAERYTEPRLPRIGWDRPKASDHCPVVVTLRLP